MSLRSRLFCWTTAIVALCVGGVGWTATRTLERALDEREAERLETARSAVAARLERLRGRAATRLAAVAAEVSDTRGEMAWDTLAARHGVESLQAIDDGGRIVGSSVWPAGQGLPLTDRAVDETKGVYSQRVARGAGYAERLAVVARTNAKVGHTSLTLVGGFFLDGEVLEGLGDLVGADVTFVDTSSGRLLIDVRPRGEATARRAALRHTLLSASLAALGIGVLLGGLLADRVASRLTRLSRAAEAIAAGDRSARLPEESADEIGDLGRALNEMAVDVRASETRLAQAGRVAFWRDLARRLAHELKNPMFPIQLSVETLRRAFEREDPRAPASPGFAKLFDELTRTLLQEVGALRRIVQEFSEFARSPEPQLRLVSVNEILGSVLDLHATRSAGVRIERGFDEALPALPADRDLLSRALTNLVANAIEAMPDGGTLRATTGLRGRHAEIVITDTGLGFSDEQKAQLFRPYHTTKPGGTGLGLVIVQSVAADHGGFVEVDGGLGTGATFRILLPLTAAS